MSVFFEILKAVQQRVATAAQSPVPKIRKSPKLLPEDSSLPVVLICPGGPEQVGMEAFTNIVSYEYPVLITIIDAFDRAWELDVASQLELREAIRNVLYQPTITTASGNVFDTTIEPLSPFSLENERSVHEVTGFRAVYKSTETRTA